MFAAGPQVDHQKRLIRPKWFDDVWDGSEDQPVTRTPTFIFDHPKGTVWQVPIIVQLRDRERGRWVDYHRHHYLIVRPDGNELWVRRRQPKPPEKPLTEDQLSLLGMSDAIELCIKGVRGQVVTEEELNEMAV